MNLPPGILEAAKLTKKEEVAYRLSMNGASQRVIAAHLGISRWAVRDRLAEADRKIHRAMKEAA